MAALGDFKNVPALKYIFVKDALSGKQAFINLDGLMVRIQGIEYDITRLKNDVLKLKDRFKDLDAALDTIDKALDTIREIRKELLNAMSALRQELNDQVTRIDGQLVAHDSRLTDLEARAAAIENDVSELRHSLDSVVADVAAVQKQANANTAAIEQIKEKLTEVDESLEQLGTAIEQIHQDLRDNYAKLHEVNTFTAANTFRDSVTVERSPDAPEHATNKRYVDSAIARAMLPAGSIVAYAGAIVPDGYLLCDGTMIDKDDYPALYAAIGGVYGETDSKFKLPDLRDRFIQGGAAPSAVTQQPQLPNIMGNFTGFGDPALSDGAFTSVLSTESRGKIEPGKTDGMLLTHFDASKYSPYYKNGAARIVPLSYVMMFLIKV